MSENLFWTVNLAVMVVIVVFGAIAVAYVTG